MTNTVHFLFTGGTIDSYYDVTKDTAVPYKASVIPSYLDSLKLYGKFRYSKICMKDSRELNDSDRKKIVQIIEKSSATKFIITHGTYTMPITAQYLAKQLKRRDAVIVLTGSMIPLTGFSPSDAGFSLGFALSQVNELSPGVHLCMNGKAFVSSSVKKNIKKGRFES